MRFRFSAIVLAGLMAISLALSASGEESSDDQKVVRAMTEAINDRQLDALDALISQSIRRHSGATPGLTIENIDQFKAFLEQDFAAVPDSHQEITHIFSSGGLVAVRAIYSGTQSGPWGPFPASDKTLELPFIGILKIEAGKVSEIWVEWDNLNALQQLGHLGLPKAAQGGE